MFASQVTDTVTIGEVVVTVRKLSWKSLGHAAEIKQNDVMALMAKAGNAAGQLSDRREHREKVEPTVQQKHEARYTQYDRGAVLQAGVKAWSATDKKLPGALDDLDEAVAEQLHRAILDLSLPSLEDGAEAAAQKNG
jgi:hypothetical protein